jgi:hypothetical protein
MDIKSCKKALEEMESNVRENLRECEVLLSQKQVLESKKNEKIKKIEDTKSELNFEEIYQNNLSERNEEMRKKLSAIDTQLKMENDKINEETKNFFQIINCKASIQRNKSNEKYLTVKLEFLERNNSFVIFFYDPITNDYDCKLI